MTSDWSTNDIDEEEEKSCLELVALLRALLITENVTHDQKKYELHNNIANLLTNVPTKCLIALKLNYENMNSTVIDEELTSLKVLLDLLQKKFELGLGTFDKIVSKTFISLYKCLFKNLVVV